MIKNNNEKLVKSIYKTITSYKKVTIFMHTNPDNDAYGSSLAMALWLRKMKIDARIAGTDLILSDSVKRQYDDSIPQADDKFVKASIGIVLDLGVSKNLINDQFKLCKETLRIDHHVKVETFCDTEWVDPEYSSTCEMVGYFMLENNPKLMDAKICEALYVGILTDSGNLQFSCAKASTYELVAKFFDYGFDKQKKQEELYTKSWEDLQLNNKLYKLVKVVDNEIGYLVITPRIAKKYHVPDGDGKVYLLQGIKEFKIWFAVYWNEQKKAWKVSIRSRNYPVRDVAMKFGGGGHVLASGFTISSLKDVKTIIEEARALLVK